MADSPEIEIQKQNEKFQQFLQEAGPLMEKYGFDLTVLIMKNFASPRPNIFFRGQAFDCSVLLSKVADDFKYEILSQFYSKPMPQPPADQAQQDSPKAPAPTGPTGPVSALPI
jgi:hypothetical protein